MIFVSSIAKRDGSKAIRYILFYQFFQEKWFLCKKYNMCRYIQSLPFEKFRYLNLDNSNLLLESGEILKQKWHKATKNGMLKLTYMKAL